MMLVEILKQNGMDSIMESFKRFGKGWVVDYVRIGIILYFMLIVLFLYAF